MGLLVGTKPKEPSAISSFIFFWLFFTYFIWSRQSVTFHYSSFGIFWNLLTISSLVLVSDCFWRIFIPDFDLNKQSLEIFQYSSSDHCALYLGLLVEIVKRKWYSSRWSHINIRLEFFKRFFQNSKNIFFYRRKPWRILMTSLY